MKPVTITLLVLALFSGHAMAEDTIEDRCADKWPTDFKMQAYCIERQEDGLSKVQGFLLAHDLGGENLEARVKEGDAAALIAMQCFGKWSDDYSMLDYCIANQVEAAKRLGKL